MKCSNAKLTINSPAGIRTVAPIVIRALTPSRLVKRLDRKLPTESRAAAARRKSRISGCHAKLPINTAGAPAAKIETGMGSSGGKA